MERELPFPVAVNRSLIWPRALRASAAAAVAVLLLAPAGAGPAFAAPAVAPAHDLVVDGTAARKPVKKAPRKAVVTQSRTKAKARPAARRAGRRGIARVARAVAAPVMPWTSPRGVGELAGDLGNMLDARVRSGKWGVMIVSLTRGDTLFARNAGEMMLPASTMKLFSTAAALDRFGPEYSFSTDVLRDQAVGADGTLGGNIYLRGDGDPSMSSRFWKDANLPMNTLARSIAAAGVKHVRGDLVYDASAFDDQKIPDGWKTSYLGAAYAARVSALSLNENLVWVVVQPEGRTAKVTLEPATSTIPVNSSVRVVGGRGGRISAHRSSDGTMQVSGSIGASSGPLKYSLVVDDPAQFTAGALRAALQTAGVTVDGAVRPGKTPANAQKIAGFASPPMSQIISEMNRESINVVAELLFRDAARATAPGGQSSADAGLANMRAFLQTKVGANPAAIDVADGSGLSTLDRLTPRTMIQLLSYAHRGPWSSAFHGSLPVAGESELLRKRMRSTPAQGNLHAKTGTTNDVVGLGGYVTAKDGEIVAFSFIYNGNDRWNAKSAMDSMGATLANFVRE
jgi:D-alanyl-D-alanine carboxypeptidase/D-alanyl-D-alanine-endopeptidase (penicillin-binding protein 4)